MTNKIADIITWYTENSLEKIIFEKGGDQYATLDVVLQKTENAILLLPVHTLCAISIAKNVLDT